MHFDHVYFKDRSGTVHMTNGVMGEASSMLCEVGDQFYLSMKELKPAGPPVTCMQCIAHELKGCCR